jgi:molybdate transport system ATP-binding protein
VAEVLVEIENADVRHRLTHILENVSLKVHAGEVWVVTGTNGSGKSTLGRLLAGRQEPWSGRLDLRAARPALVSFESAEEELRRIRREDMSGIMHGATDPGRTPLDLVPEALRDRLLDPESEEAAIVSALRIGHILHRGLRYLSTGELRKAMLAGELARRPDLLVLDDPYDGIDAAARAELSELVRHAATPATAVVLVTGRQRDFPGNETHVLELAEGKIVYSGDAATWHAKTAASAALSGSASSSGGPAASAKPADSGRELVGMRHVSVAYGSAVILKDISWTIRTGERWMLHGPNGSGKSTLLSLISGENPKAYGQDIRLFGKQKGTGESVWEIKRRIGYVSGDLHVRYPDRFTVREVVLSGLRDSVGLYEEPSGYEVEEADELLERFGLAGSEAKRLRELSFGLQRLALIARAVIKKPTILIADEPCQGLDDEHTSLVLDMLDSIGGIRAAENEGGLPALLYVTHDPAERLACLTHTIELEPGEAGSTARVKAHG